LHKRITVLSVVGTRPEVIKMAPVIAEIERHQDRLRSVVCVTGQHREMLDQAMQAFDLKPDYDLALMRPGQTLSALTVRLLEGLDAVVGQVRPGWIIAQGDTTSVMASALTALHHRTLFAHVEAGLRTAELYSPFPEEANRRLADSLASLWFAPTEHARQTLLKEGCPERDVILSGNTVIDALKQILARGYDWSAGPLASLPRGRRMVLATVHRRESFGEPLREICAGLRRVAAYLAGEGGAVILPVHPNPEVREPVFKLLADVPNIRLLEPLDYPSLVHLMQHSVLVLTDSGGIQEEAPSLGVPVLVMRDTTERPEGIRAGVARLVGTRQGEIAGAALRLLKDPMARAAMVDRENPYGDGEAARRIVQSLLRRGPV